MPASRGASADSNSDDDFAPDYSKLYGAGLLSDIHLVVREEKEAQQDVEANPKPKRARRSTAAPDSPERIILPAHGMLLWSLSKFFQAKLENWSKSNDTPEVDLLVPPGQLAIGEALIKAMYEKQPDLSALSQQQQLQLLQLADAYGVMKVASAACRSLSQGSHGHGLDMATAIAICELPETCKQLKPYKALKAAAISRLQEEMGDLELVWASGDGAPLQQQLLGLSFATLFQLLSDSQTKVASEDTVHYTLTRWLQQNPDTSQEQQQQLAELIRLPHCTPNYVSTVICQDESWVRSCISSADLFKACALSGISSSSSIVHRGCALFGAVAFIEDAPVMKRHPSWTLPRRPASCLRALVVDWKLPVAELQATFEDAISTKAARRMESPNHMKWQGRAFYCKLKVDGGEGGMALSLYLMVKDHTNTKGHEIGADTALRAEKVNGDPLVQRLRDTWESGSGLGFEDFFDIGNHTSWEAVEQQLRSKRFVHPDGCLHLSATLSGLA